MYDEFVISGNTAVLKCHVPSFVREYVTVTSWVRGNGERIVSDVLEGNEKQMILLACFFFRYICECYLYLNNFVDK